MLLLISTQELNIHLFFLFSKIFVKISSSAMVQIFPQVEIINSREGNIKHGYLRELGNKQKQAEPREMFPLK